MMANVIDEFQTKNQCRRTAAFIDGKRIVMLSVNERSMYFAGYGDVNIKGYSLNSLLCWCPKREGNLTNFS